jgi:hypothetical protein
MAEALRNLASTELNVPLDKIVIEIKIEKSGGTTLREEDSPAPEATA